MAGYSVFCLMDLDMELPTGKGYADIIYLPEQNADKPAPVIKLKCRKSAKAAVRQVKNGQHAYWIENYTGNILLVGINYNEKKNTNVSLKDTGNSKFFCGYLFAVLLEQKHLYRQ